MLRLEDTKVENINPFIFNKITDVVKSLDSYHTDRICRSLPTYEQMLDKLTYIIQVCDRYKKLELQPYLIHRVKPTVAMGCQNGLGKKPDATVGELLPIIRELAITSERLILDYGMKPNGKSTMAIRSKEDMEKALLFCAECICVKNIAERIGDVELAENMEFNIKTCTTTYNTVREKYGKWIAADKSIDQLIKANMKYVKEPISGKSK